MPVLRKDLVEEIPLSSLRKKVLESTHIVYRIPIQSLSVDAVDIILRVATLWSCAEVHYTRQLHESAPTYTE